jgi:hypothetical protein
MDYPRFEPIVGRPDDVHRRYHGGPLVTLAFALADRWTKVRGRPAGRRVAERRVLRRGRRDGWQDPMREVDMLLLEEALRRGGVNGAGSPRPVVAGILAAVAALKRIAAFARAPRAARVARVSQVPTLSP